MKKSAVEKVDFKLTFPPWIAEHGVLRPTVEYRFHPFRQWRFDFAWPPVTVALEIEGGVFGYTDPLRGKQSKGAHSSPEGLLRDIDKYNAAQVLGWTVLRVVPDELFTPATAAMVQATIEHAIPRPQWVEPPWTPAKRPTPKRHRKPARLARRQAMRV